MASHVRYLPPGTKVTILNGALDDFEGDIVLRGVVDPQSFSQLQVDDYQREVLLGAKVKDLKKALRNGGVPDILLGMRGGSYDEVKRTGTFTLKDPVFIIDGLQRTSSALQCVAEDPEHPPRLGAMIYFDTNKEFEKKKFVQVNSSQSRVNGNVFLHTMREDDDKTALGAIFALSYKEDLKKKPKDGEFVLAGRISWKQRMISSDLITAVTYLKVVAMLHSHAGPGRSNHVVPLALGLEKIQENIGKRNLTANVKHFFEVLDRAFGVRDLESRTNTPWLNMMFMVQLARVLSDHDNFWRDEKLLIDARTVKKLQQFKFDRSVLSLVSSGGSANEILYNLLVSHINSGRTTNRLRERSKSYDEMVANDEFDTQSDDEDEAGTEEEA